MKIIQLICIIGIMLLSGCDTLKKETVPSSTPSTMYSDVEGKYYITALGTTDKQNLEFQQVIDQNIKIIAGYYQTNTPSDAEMKMYEIKNLPKYIVFDTEKEIYETDNLNELNHLLTTLQK
ncbi:hypothetical protein [Paenibacillus sp. Marseille-Q4541]|uniref:hypothetical protein n=1 Tax=Paenibacillus sp. Marseille-Q4541 TaxID=2831522 RepID=UPI001BA87345|nr:hypothetical protein [Paenibacillus sp. Marseille-Q4541]